MIASTQYSGKISKLAMVAPLAEITRPIKRTIVLRTGLGFRQGYVSNFSRQSPREYAHHLRPLVAKSAYLDGDFGQWSSIISRPECVPEKTLSYGDCRFGKVLRSEIARDDSSWTFRGCGLVQLGVCT